MSNYRKNLDLQKLSLAAICLSIIGSLILWIYHQQQYHWESKYILSTDKFELDNSTSSWRMQSNSLEVMFSSDKYVFMVADEVIIFLRELQKSSIDSEVELANSSILFLSEMGIRVLDSVAEPMFLTNEDLRIRSLVVQLLKGGTRSWIGGLGFFAKKIPSDLAIIFERETNTSYVLSINFYGSPRSMIALSYALLLGLKKAFQHFNADLKISLLDTENQLAFEITDALKRAKVFFEDRNPDALKAMQDLREFEKSFWKKVNMYLDKDLMLEFSKIEQVAEMSNYPADQYFSYFSGFLQRPLWRMCQISNFILKKYPKVDVESCDLIYQKFNSTNIEYRGVFDFYYASIDHAFRLVRDRSTNLITLLGPSYLRSFELPPFQDYVRSGSYISSMKRNFLRTYYLPAATSLLMVVFLIIILWRKNVNANN